MDFKPMLAGTPKSLDNLKFPLLASSKLDGVRAVVKGGVLLSRSLKRIPNAYCQALFSNLPEGMDGELILGAANEDPYRRTVSAVMSEDGEPTDIGYHIFDNFTDKCGFNVRHTAVSAWQKQYKAKNVVIVPHVLISSLEELREFEAAQIELGFEGAMARSLVGPYKFGRSTEKEGYLLKIKRFRDAEAVIIGFDERLHNANEAFTNELGRTARSTHAANMVGRGDLGTLIVTGLNDPYKGVEFGVGTGFDDAERASIWASRKALTGKIIKFKYFETGSKDAPRFPVFKGFRDPIDM